MTTTAAPLNAPPADFATRVQGTLMGGALGDAFGYLVEFDSLAEIAAKYGPALLLDLSQAHGTAHFSDDTQMTLYTLDGLLDVLEWANNGVSADINACQWLAYLRWLKTQGIEAAEHAPAQSARWIDAQSVLHHQRHPGNACVSGLATGDMGTIFRPVNLDSKGCGTVMRSAPYGLLPNIDAETIYKISSEGASLTHGHPAARQSSAAFSWLIHALVMGGLNLREAATSARDRAVAEPKADAELLARLEAALTLSAHDAGHLHGDSLTDALGLGWVAEEALAVALYSVLATEAAAVSPVANFLAAIRLATNHSGDSDSTASIAGNILGAFYGEAALPPSWLTMAEAPILIRHLGAEFIKLTTGE
ncbi:ADP-ribosylglycohydrolase family protein [Arthrobacter psychrolactophilus]